MTLSGRTAVITGCGQGIGRAIAERFIGAGAEVALLDIAEGPLKELIRAAQDGGCRVLALRCDVSNEADTASALKRVAERFGKVDALVNVAGLTGPVAPIEEVSREDWEQTLAVNLTSVFLMCRGILPGMKARRAGSIVNIASLLATKGKKLRTPYASSKWGLIGLTRSLALEAGPFNVRVNAICPGTVDGERIARLQALEAEETGVPVERIREQVIQSTPLRRMITVEDVAAVALFLASDESSGVTGEEILVTAGKP
jgi:NAD(P)-dependent dehydrogenase (short-subunit alcohol dehydrogenase family)